MESQNTIVEDQTVPSRIAGGSLRGAGAMLLLVARAVLLAAAVVCIVIALAILLRVVDANAGNSVVKAIHDAGHALVGPFDGMFTLDHHAKGTLALNWGVAAVVYLIVGSLVAGLIRRPAIGAFSAARGMIRRRTIHRPAIR
jgi:hypothetical protein